MKRIVAMLLAAAALACCAGCGDGHAEAVPTAQATVMTKEDFYVYQNGEMLISDVYEKEIEYEFQKTDETKRGIHMGSTLKELEQAYYGVSANWEPEDTRTNHGIYKRNILIGQDALEEKGRLRLEGYLDMAGKFHMDSEYNGGKLVSVWFNICIDPSLTEDGIVNGIYIHNTIF